MKRILKSRKLQAWIFLIVAIGISIATLVFIAHNSDKIQSLIHSVGIAGPLVSILLYAVLSVTPIPSDPLTIINGAVFGPLFGILISWLGNNLAAMVEYYIGEGIGEISDFEKQRKRLPFGLGKFPADSPWFLIFGRFVPQFGGISCKLLF